MFNKNLLLFALLTGVVLASGCTDSGDQVANNTNTTQTYSGDEFTLNYPLNWQQIQSTAPNSTVAFGDPKSANSDGNVQISVVIQRTLLSQGITLQEYYNSTYAQFAAQNLGYKPISEGSVLINSKNVLENIYYINSGSIQKQERALWIQKNNRVIYVILCSAPVSDFSDQQENFNIIVNSFRLI